MKKITQKKKPQAKLSSAFLAKQKKQLAALHEHLVRRTESVETDLARADGDERDFEEQAAARENDDVLSALSGEGRGQLARIDAALERIEAGTYGLCAGCGGPIARERLEALPYATACIDCSR
jgi:RNA polymerase-binding protein DksA